ncbi:SAM-dependent methyltransferase [Marinilabiliaceae bacterium JC017]|nr:SAM-dependent methyltransferase [Marinilabiliaceae bacterium JC017]
MTKKKLASGREIEVMISEDGSHTLFVPELNEHYHSTHGAIQESMHVFINAGLAHCKKENLSILEIGLGTGLNAFLTALNRGAHQITYHSLEKYPITEEVVKELNYCAADDPQQKELFEKLHQLPWNKQVPWTAGMELLKLETDLTSVNLPSTYDLVYFDAFAPDIQPEMWSDEIFSKLYSAMNPGGILTTYCAKGIIRRRLIAAGFKVERLPGPPGKREMMRATKSIDGMNDDK